MWVRRPALSPSLWPRGMRCSGMHRTRLQQLATLALISALAVGLTACGEDRDSATTANSPALVSLSGDATRFIAPPNGRIPNAAVWILEQPERRFVTGADGHFQFDDLLAGSEVTLVMDHPDYAPIQTGTIRLGPNGAERVTFQAPEYVVYDFYARALRIQPDSTKCQLVTTVTRRGKSIYDPGSHGEAGATVSIDPPLPAENGPVYFNADVLPDRRLRETSPDGGVAYTQVPPGEYTWTAHKPGVIFSQIKMKCRAGLLVNASPPWGLQVE